MGPGSSPILWNGLVILQVDTQADSFVIALNADTGETVWKTDRDELPSWATPTVAMTPAGPELVTNASKFVRGYDPQTGKELWRLGGSSKITAPTPIFANDLFVVASGRAPERPIFAIKPGSRGDLTLENGETSSAQSSGAARDAGRTCRHRSFTTAFSTCWPTTACSTPTTSRPDEEIYRQRLDPIGSGFSASPMVADDKIYLSSEDGEILVVAAGQSVQTHRHQLDGRPADGHASVVRRRDVRAHRIEPVCRRPEMNAIRAQRDAIIQASTTRQ